MRNKKQFSIYPFSLKREYNKANLLKTINSLNLNNKSCEVIIKTIDDDKYYTNLRHIQQSNTITLTVNNRVETWANFKDKVHTIYFIDELKYHDTLDMCWIDGEFRLDLDMYNNTKRYVLEQIK
jgi:hypothetical protein